MTDNLRHNALGPRLKRLDTQFEIQYDWSNH